MTEINFHIGVNEFNSFENETYNRKSRPIAETPKGIPLIIDAMIKEDSELGERLRQLMKAGGYSFTFNIDIDARPMSKSKMRRFRCKQNRTSAWKNETES